MVGLIRRATPDPVKRLAGHLRNRKRLASGDARDETVELIITPEALNQTKRSLKDSGIKGGANTAVIVHQAIERGVRVVPGHRQRADLIYQGCTGWIRGANSSLNTAAAKRLARDKSLLSEELRSRGLRAPKNRIFDRADLERAWGWAMPILPVVVKPPKGYRGSIVHVTIDDFLYR